MIKISWEVISELKHKCLEAGERTAKAGLNETSDYFVDFVSWINDLVDEHNGDPDE